MNSPARVSRRKTRPRSASLVLTGHPVFLRETSILSSRVLCRRLVSGSFHTPLGVLFSFPSRYLCAIGLGTCLDLEAGGSRLPTVKPDHGTLVPGGGLHGFAYGAVTLYGGVFQPTSATMDGPPGLEAQPGTRNTTFPYAHRIGVWFGLSPFRSPLLRGSRLVSLPPPTKMFSFGGFPSGAPDATSCSPVAGGPIRESRVLRLHAPRPGVSPLATPFLGARAEPSTRRLQRRSPGDRVCPNRRLEGPIHGHHRQQQSRMLARPFTWKQCFQAALYY